MSESDNKEPLVTIVVVTYNSSKYVIETLDSAYNQTYKNIELIITDDSSTDNTISVCREWLVTHQERFISTEIVEAKENKGIGSNCNRGLEKANGEWVKFIAGDDCLLEDCINTLIKNTYLYSDYKIFLTNIISWDGQKVLEYLVCYSSKVYSTKKQLRALLINSFTWFIPGIIFHRRSFIDIGGFDTKYPLFEDYPTLIKCAIAGLMIKKLNFNGVLYRVHENQVTNRVFNKERFAKFSEDYYAFSKEKCKLLFNNKWYIEAWHCWLWEICPIRRIYVYNFFIKMFIISIIDPYYLGSLIFRVIKFIKKVILLNNKMIGV